MVRRARSWVWLAMLAVAAALVGAGPARADFTETFCDGSAAARWTSAFAGTFDECASGAGLEFLNPSADMAAGTSVGAQLNLAGGGRSRTSSWPTPRWTTRAEARTSTSDTATT